MELSEQLKRVQLEAQGWDEDVLLLSDQSLFSTTSTEPDNHVIVLPSVGALK